MTVFVVTLLAEVVMLILAIVALAAWLLYIKVSDLLYVPKSKN